MIDINNPEKILIKSEGIISDGSNAVDIIDNKVYLTANRVSEVTIIWGENYDDSTLFLGDAWERSYGDLNFKRLAEADTIIPWYFLAERPDGIECLGVKVLPNSFCRFKVRRNSVRLIIDVRCGGEDVVLGGRIIEACEIVTKRYDKKDLYESLKDFCRLMSASPVLPAFPVYGGNDWYCDYGQNSFESVKRHTEFIAKCSEGLKNRPFMVIDDGWQICRDGQQVEPWGYNGGPWKYPNMKFDDMKKMADTIKSYDVRPGIWFRPLYTMEHFPVEMYLKRPGVKILDPSLDAVKEKVRSDIETIKGWGYELIKHDFTTIDSMGRYGIAMMGDEMLDSGWAFADTGKTTAEIIKELYQVIKDSAGDTLVIGCNTISHLSAGMFPVQRIGDDTSGIDFGRTLKMGVNTLAFRMCQNNVFYYNDADCAGITKEIPWELNREWLRLLAVSGTALFVSVANDCETDEVKEELTAAFKTAAENKNEAVPVDWKYSKTPSVWNTVRGRMRFNWDMG